MEQCKLKISQIPYLNMYVVEKQLTFSPNIAWLPQAYEESILSVNIFKLSEPPKSFFPCDVCEYGCVAYREIFMKLVCGY